MHTCRGRPNLGVLWDFNVTMKAADVPPYSELQSRFSALRSRLAQPPIDMFPAVYGQLKEAQRLMKERQRDSDSLIIMVPFGDANAPIRQIPRRWGESRAVVPRLPIVPPPVGNEIRENEAQDTPNDLVDARDSPGAAVPDVVGDHHAI